MRYRYTLVMIGVHPLTVAPRPTARQRLTRDIKRLAAECGLDIARVTSAEPFPELQPVLIDHIAQGYVQGLDWFTAERATFSTVPRNLHPGARSILAVGVAYWTVDAGKPADGVTRGRIARYAWGVDYHDLLKRRMENLHRAIEEEIGAPVDVRCLVDTARIVDRAVAARAGLGWYGKHSCLIVPSRGSGVLLGEMLLSIELEPDESIDKTCGRCTICLDNCPTGAIVAPYTIDSPRCLSFQTIEQRGSIPWSLRASLGDWVFGCDICQEVCPYTRAIRLPADPAFRPPGVEHAYPSLPRLLAISEEEFRARYRGTPVLRAKRRGLARNAAVALGNIGDESAVRPLRLALETHDEPLVRGHAAWALGRLAERGIASTRAVLTQRHRLEADAGVREELAGTLEWPAATRQASALPPATTFDGAGP